MSPRAKSNAYPVREERVSSVRDFLNRVVLLRAEWAHQDKEEPEDCEPWFRGEPDADAEYPLCPGRYRAASMDDEEQEDELRYAFAQRGIQFSGIYRPISDWEWYFLMQHYGAPTRLLDWTEGALLGLYFALRPNDGTTDAAVWVLDAWWLNRHAIRSRRATNRRRLGRHYEWALDHLPDPTDPKTRWIVDYLPEAYSAKPLPRLPATLRPPHIDQRIAVQLSAFTIHGSNPDGLLKVAERDRHARPRAPPHSEGQGQDDMGRTRSVWCVRNDGLPGLGRLGARAQEYVYECSHRLSSKCAESTEMMIESGTEERWPLGCEEEWGSTT